MRARNRLAMAIAAASVFAVAAAASAAGTLGLSASPLKVTYPHGATLTAAFTDVAEPATATIESMPTVLIGDSVWTTMTPKATTTTPTIVVRPKVTTAYRAWTEGTGYSGVTTISVAAKLSKPQVNGNVHRNRSYTIKGTMQPSEAGTVTVKVYRRETIFALRGHRRIAIKEDWVLHTDRSLALKRLNATTSTWSMKWTPDASGTWKAVVTHEDATHVLSSATSRSWWVR